MNEKRDFRQEFEDFMADQRENWAASKDEIAKEAMEEAIEEAKKQITKQVTKQITKQVTEQNRIDVILQMFNNGFTPELIAKGISMDVQDIENIIENNQDKSKTKSK